MTPGGKILHYNKILFPLLIVINGPEMSRLECNSFYPKIASHMNPDMNPLDESHNIGTPLGCFDYHQF